jgi:predicted dinucleotide-utilizing enzyme
MERVTLCHVAEISVGGLGDRAFEVQVRDGAHVTTHRVTVPDGLAAGLGVRDDQTEHLVRESFRFLLEREPSSSILREFSLDEISRYFPEYRSELARRLS